MFLEMLQTAVGNQPDCQPYNSLTFRSDGLGGGISFYSRTLLVIIRSTFTAKQYVNNILCLIVLPFISCHPGLTFQQDNACLYTAIVSTACLHASPTLPWPARSLDHFPIENVWSIMARVLQPAWDFTNQMCQLDRIWHKILQEDTFQLYQ